MASLPAELIYCHLQSDRLLRASADRKSRERSERMMKKLLWILFLILISANISLAQNVSATPAPAKPMILKYDWSKEIVLPAGWDWTPFGASSSAASDPSGGESDLPS